MKRLFWAFFASFTFVLLASSMTFAQTPEAAEQWKKYGEKYGGMPPLDIRVSIDGRPVVGLFEAALARKQGQARISLKERAIPVVVGQVVAFKVEISPRGANQWTDVTQHKNLSIDSPSGKIEIDQASSRLRIRPTAIDGKLSSIGLTGMIFYYSVDFDPKDEQFAYTELDFDIRAKP